MKKTLLTFACIFIALSFTFSQSSKVSGHITDSLGFGLINASVMLLEEDSTMIEFTQTNNEGKFSMNKVPYGNYLIKVTYVGYIPVTKPISADKKEIDLGKMVLNEINVQLMEVVVKAARAPLKMRGDTIEFDITQFKVPQNSTLEDLIKRLPGMEVGEAGAIKMDGKDVTSVKVDGKNFFGNNPTMATKNLPAEGVSTVQVYDKKTDEQKATGSNLPTNEKEMNVVLKDDFKNITFGKGTVGAGNIDRLEGKLSLNKFTPLHQYSFIGVGNNTGRNGLGWDDREDFFGAQAYNDFEELKYGFSSNMRFSYYYEEDDINLDNKISELFWNNNTQGFPRNGLLGLNYNYEGEKLKAGSRYVFSHKGSDIESFRSVNRFLPNNTTNFDTTSSNTINRGNVHKIEGNVSWDIDSFNTLKLRFDYSNLISERDFSSIGSSYRNGLSNLISTSDINNQRNNAGALGRGTLIYNKKFRKKGRFIGLNSTFSNSGIEETTLNRSLINFSSSLDEDLNQTFNNEASKSNFQFNATYNEPLSKRIFFNLFHNFDKTNQEGDVLVKDKKENKETINEILTRSYTTDVLYNFTGTNLRYAHEGFNFTLGYGIQTTSLRGDFKGFNSGIVDTTFRNQQFFTNIVYQFSRNSSVSGSYTRGVSTPRISQLTPVINNANPLYIREGNPNLQPEINNQVFGNFWLSKPISGFRFSMWSNFTVKENAITQEEIVTESLITTTRPVNYKDSRNFYFSPDFSFPIIKNKLRTSIRFNVDQNYSYRLVNGVENKTETFGYGPSVTFNITPNQNFSLFLSSRINQAKTEYSINTSQNQTILTQNHSATLSMKVAKGTFINSNYTHRFFENDRFGQKTNIPIINTSVSKQFLKGNKGEIRLAVYDILNQNRNFNLFAGTNTVSQNETLALARYVMVSFSYNIKGLKSGVTQNNNDYW